MTEADWLASEDPAAMLRWWRDRQASAAQPIFPSKDDRKLRLFACACCAANGTALASVDAYERDGPPAQDGVQDHTDLMWAKGWTERSPRVSQARKAALLRDVVGNPYRPVTIAREVRECCGKRWANADGPQYCPTCGDLAACSLQREAWLTPQVLSLARAAYEERERTCRLCNGAAWVQPYPRSAYGTKPNCPDCNGAGRIDDGTLDPLTLCAVADALEEAGATGVCVICKDTKRTIDVDSVNEIISRPMGMDAADTAIEAIKAGIIGNKVCLCNKGRLSHPIVEHLRSPSPHYRGCWALDLIYR